MSQRDKLWDLLFGDDDPPGAADQLRDGSPPRTASLRAIPSPRSAKRLRSSPLPTTERQLDVITDDAACAPRSHFVGTSSSSSMASAQKTSACVTALPPTHDGGSTSQSQLSCPTRASALVRGLLAVALATWRGDQPRVVPPFSILDMQGGSVVSPRDRGIAFHPALRQGKFLDCKHDVTANLRYMLDSRLEPVFYIVSTTDLLWRWRDCRDKRNNKYGHVWSRNNRWHCLVALFLTTDGQEGKWMEEHLIRTFRGERYMQNHSPFALGIKGGSRSNHWVYVCIPRG